MKMLFALITVLILSFSITKVQAQPSITFPEHMGTYAVGVTRYDLTDQNRDEILTPDPSDKRRMLLTVYYPASSEVAEAPYVGHVLGDILSEQLQVNPEIWNIIDTNISTGVPVATGTFPVLIFSPGMGTIPIFYTALLSELASHGYVVAAMWHPYSTDVTVFPDDTVIVAEEETPPGENADVAAMEARRAQLLEVWVSDAIFTLDQLSSFNENDDLLSSHLDLSRIGIFGHSFGGATAAQAAYQDSRFLAAVNMDGTMSGPVAENGIQQPFMMMQTEDEFQYQEPTDEELAASGITREQYEIMSESAIVQRLTQTSAAGTVVTLRNTAHETFTTDLLIFAPFFPHLITPEMIGAQDKALAMEMINSYLLAFFEQHVKGTETPFPEYAQAVVKH